MKFSPLCQWHLQINKQVKLHFQPEQLGEEKLLWYEFPCLFLRSILLLSGLTNTLAPQDVQKFKILPLPSPCWAWMSPSRVSRKDQAVDSNPAPWNYIQPVRLTIATSVVDYMPWPVWDVCKHNMKPSSVALTPVPNVLATYWKHYFVLLLKMKTELLMIYILYFIFKVTCYAP